MYKVWDLSELECIDYKVLDVKMSGAQVIKAYGADFALNATLYDVATGKVITYSEDENKGIGYLFSQNGIGISGAKDLSWTNYKSARANDNIRDFIGGSPTLVVDGKINIDAGTTDSWILKSKSYRSFIGFNGTKLYLGASDYTNTISGLASYCKEQGMKYAINLDGGGSCTLLEMKNGKVKYHIDQESRRNASWILIYLKGNKNAPYKSFASTPTVTPPTQEKPSTGGNTMHTVQCKDIDIQINKKSGEKKRVKGIVIDGVSYAPVRAYAESLGDTVGYSNGLVTIDEK